VRVCDNRSSQEDNREEASTYQSWHQLQGLVALEVDKLREVRDLVLVASTQSIVQVQEAAHGVDEICAKYPSSIVSRRPLDDVTEISQTKIQRAEGLGNSLTEFAVASIGHVPCVIEVVAGARHLVAKAVDVLDWYSPCEREG
jgi:hypothetical protein